MSDKNTFPWNINNNNINNSIQTIVHMDKEKIVQYILNK